MKKIIGLGMAASFLALGTFCASAQLYLDVGAGAAFKNDLTVKRVGVNRSPNAKFEFDPGYRVDLAVGYFVHPVVGVEFQTGLVHNSIDAVRVGGTRTRLSDFQGAPGGFDIDLYQVPLMANVVYRPDFGSPLLKPFIGVGAGGLVNVGKFKAQGDKDTETDLTFGYQGTAGLTYTISHEADLSLVYRFLTGTDLNFGGILQTRAPVTHSIGLALTVRF